MTFTRSIFTCAAVSLLAVPVGACGDDTGSGGGGGGVPDGQACQVGEGCPAVESQCVAFVDNAGKDKFALRISELAITKPEALTQVTITKLLATGILYDYPQCTSESGLALFNGDGTFNWILEFDTAANTLRTGGAPIETDPNKGYCFLEGDIGGFNVAPLVADITISENNGQFSTNEPRDVVVPIFTDVNDSSKVILLPLRGVTISGPDLSQHDNNCIGVFSGAELDPNNLCLADADTPTFEPDGELSGYITLEDADAVLVPELGNKSLCTLFATPELIDQEAKKCKRDANDQIELKGDWCAGADESDPGTPATAECADSVQLAAGYAASAVAVRTDCN